MQENKTKNVEKKKSTATAEEKKVYKELGMKAIAVVYMTALTILVSYFVSRIFFVELWENERISITALIAAAFFVTMVYFVIVEKGLLAMMSMYHIVLLGTIVCVLLPIEYAPIALLPVIMTLVYDLKTGFIISITVTSILFIGLGWEYPQYLLGAALPVIGVASCFAAWKHKKIYKNIAGTVFFVLIELVSIWAFQLFCEGSIYEEYQKTSFLVTAMITGILSVVLGNLLSVIINWIAKKKAPAMYLKKISDDNYKAVLLIKNKSTSLYYHSTEVAELARLAARRIDADEALAYAGGIYHDLGKVAGSEYIKEGLILAEKYGLPKSVKAIMVEHNVKARLPRSKEAAIVMLCDTAISAVEYLKGTMDKKDISEKAIMENALNKRVSSGALHKSSLTIEEFDKIKEVLIKIKEQQ